MYAGTFFTNGNLVLCGYQQNKKIPNISGFGGKKEDSDPTLTYTAIRETLEELFDIKPDNNLINIIIKYIDIKKIIIHNDYHMVVCSFEDLELMLNILFLQNIKSNLYDILPTNISEIIFKRNIDINSEISHLCLLPLKENVQINTDFIQDIHQYLVQK